MAEDKIISNEQLRFLSYVPQWISESDCQIWQGAKDARGRGVFKTETGKTVKVHRYMYRLGDCVPSLEDGMFVIQTCRNPACVNLLHLRALDKDEYQELKDSGEM